MTVEKLELKSNPGATLTAYLLDTSKEMPNMTDRPNFKSILFFFIIIYLLYQNKCFCDFL